MPVGTSGQTEFSEFALIERGLKAHELFTLIGRMLVIGAGAGINFTSSSNELIRYLGRLRSCTALFPPDTGTVHN